MCKYKSRSTDSYASVNSSGAHALPPPGANPRALAFFFKKMGKYPGVETHKLSKCPGVGTKKEGKCPTLVSSPSNTFADFHQ